LQVDYLDVTQLVKLLYVGIEVKNNNDFQ